MNNIAEFFRKITGRHAAEVMLRTTVQDAIKQHTSIPVPLEAISFRSTSVLLQNINQTAKSVIFIKKPQIVRDINRAQTVRIVTDIR